ncbi:hypothetical protein V6000_002046 [Aspergillus fumigatus]
MKLSSQSRCPRKPPRKGTAESSPGGSSPATADVIGEGLTNFSPPPFPLKTTTSSQGSHNTFGLPRFGYFFTPEEPERVHAVIECKAMAITRKRELCQRTPNIFPFRLS